MWTSLILRRTMRMLTSVSLAFLKKRWNVPKTLTFFNWFGESHVTHRNKLSRTISTKEQSFNAFSAESKKAIKESGNHWDFRDHQRGAEVAMQVLSSIIVIQESYTAYVDVCMTTDSAENRKYISSTLDSFSIPCFYIRKDRPRGHRYGKAPGCKEYHTANQLAKEMP